MTTPTSTPPAGGTVAAVLYSAAHPDAIIRTVPDQTGETIATWRQCADAGVNPVVGFGAAIGLRAYLGKEDVRAALSARQQQLLTAPTKVIQAAKPAASEDAAKTNARSLSKALAEKVAARTGFAAAGGRIAAHQGAKLAVGAALRVGALGLIGTPVLGAAIAVALWALDPDQRNFVNGLISEIMGPGVAPALDAPPSPPRTHFLPLTNDGNRDPSIVKMDKGMVHANDAAFRYHPDDVWPTNAPRIATTSDFSSAMADATAFARHVGDLKAAITNAYQQHGSEPSVARLWQKIKPQLDKFDELAGTIVPAMSRALMDGAVNANNFYQKFREVNLRNRMEINNSTSGLIPFRANHVNEGNMSDLTGELKSALADMDRTSKALASAADNFVITAPTLQTTTTSTTPVQPAAPPPLIVTPTPLNAPGLEQAREPQQAKDALTDALTSAARGGIPQIPMPQMPGIPQMPGMPQGLTNPASAIRQPETTKPAGLTEDALKKALGDKKNRSALFDPEKKKDPNEKPVDGAPKPGPTDPASNFTDVKGKRYKFDTPKLANFVHNLTATDGAGHKTIQQAAAEAGFKLPAPGQDIGRPISPAELKPGDVVMGPNNQNAVFLLDDNDKGMVVTEQNEVKSLNDFLPNGLTTDHVCLFHLQDDGTPAPAPPADQPVAAVAPQVPRKNPAQSTSSNR